MRFKVQASLSISFRYTKSNGQACNQARRRRVESSSLYVGVCAWAIGEKTGKYLNV